MKGEKGVELSNRIEFSLSEIEELKTALGEVEEAITALKTAIGELESCKVNLSINKC